MTELDRWQEDARAVLELRGESATWQAVNALADSMRRTHETTAGLVERERVSEMERKRRIAAYRRAI